LEFCSRDAITVRMAYKCGGGCEELIIASSYLPHDSDEPLPTEERRNITGYCHSWKNHLIIGCDTNAHHILWGNTGNNPRGESFMEYLATLKLNINQGNKPTFVVHNRREVIDLTLGTDKIGNLVANWCISDEPSLLDHTCIL
jgi:hypothetical protein